MEEDYMGRKLLTLVAVSLFAICAQSRADFKYVQSSQVTGGMMAGMMKFMGQLNKNASQAGQTTTYVKGSYLRNDQQDGSFQIIDLNGRRMIQVTPAKQTYSVTTFDELHEAMQKMQQRMSEAMRKQAGEKNNQVTMTPKIEVTPTGRTQSLLGQNTQELKIKVGMELQASNAQNGTQSGTLSTDIDSWIAPSISGYQEVSDFYKKMAAEISWTPSGFGTDPRLRSAMVELYKAGKIPQGLPLLQVLSLSGAGAPSQGTQQPPAQPSSASQSPATPSGQAMKALGGMFGRFGHKKNQEQDQEQTNQQSAASAQTPSNSLIEITMRVVSYSSDPLDSSLFQVPAGYTQVPSNVDQMLAGRH
jgi:hypothetical protein